ncbi:MAG: c-type cytochrome domain-containing protein, partial [Opitutaceae bacterium]
GYIAALIITLGLMGWTSHQGGSLTRGEDYLVERMPARVRDWLGVETRTLALAHEPTDAFYATHIQPIFEDHCVLCHGPDKVKGKLRLDSFAALMQGGESGRIVAAGHPEGSELYRRITLPKDHEEFMPAEDKKPPSEREIALIEQWILAGSSPIKTLASLRAAGADIPAEEAAASPAPQRAPDYHRKIREIAALETKLGVSLVPVSRVPTDGLILRTFGNSEAIDDETLAGLAPIAELIVDAELMRTRVTDAGMESLAGFANLRKLDLSETEVTSAGVARLASLPHLQWISLVNTGVDDAGVAHLRTFPALQKAYLFDAQLSDQSVTQLSFENDPETSVQQ